MDLQPTCSPHDSLHRERRKGNVVVFTSRVTQFIWLMSKHLKTYLLGLEAQAKTKAFRSWPKSHASGLTTHTHAHTHKQTHTPHTHAHTHMHTHTCTHRWWPVPMHWELWNRLHLWRGETWTSGWSPSTIALMQLKLHSTHTALCTVYDSKMSNVEK